MEAGSRDSELAVTLKLKLKVKMQTQINGLVRMVLEREERQIKAFQKCSLCELATPWSDAVRNTLKDGFGLTGSLLRSIDSKKWNVVTEQVYGTTNEVELVDHPTNPTLMVLRYNRFVSAVYCPTCNEKVRALFDLGYGKGVH